jgi:hypothetical protein
VDKIWKQEVANTKEILNKTVHMPDLWSLKTDDKDL